MIFIFKKEISALFAGTVCENSSWLTIAMACAREIFESPFVIHHNQIWLQFFPIIAVF